MVNRFEIVRCGKIIDANFTLIFERFLFKYETTFLQICWSIWSKTQFFYNEGSVIAGKKAIAKRIRELIEQPLLVTFLQCIRPFIMQLYFFSIKTLTLIQIGLKICFPLRKN